MTNAVIMIVAAIAFALLAVVFISIWVYKDAKQRGLSAGIWTLIVVLSGVFMGLILYVLIGRKQESGVCDKCGAAINIQGTFCPVCGEKIAKRKRAASSNKGFIYVCLTCIMLVFILLGTGLYSSFNADGFMPLYRYNSYNHSLSGSANNVRENRSGDTWEFAYDEASGGYTFSTTYNATSEPTVLSVEIKCSGSVQLIVTQNGAAINETLMEGEYCFDMAAFETGKISVKLIVVDASNLSGMMIFETKN